MKTKRIIALIATLLLAISALSIAGYAEEAPIQNEAEASVASAAGMCWACGGVGTRLEKDETKTSERVCGTHTNCVVISFFERTYYYCSNPYCTDTYYSSWVATETGHTNIH